MKTKETFVFALLALSIVAAFGGFALVSRGAPAGWIGVALAVPMMFVVQRAMRVTTTSIPLEVKAEADATTPPLER